MRFATLVNVSLGVQNGTRFPILPLSPDLPAIVACLPVASEACVIVALARTCPDLKQRAMTSARQTVYSVRQVNVEKFLMSAVDDWS